MASCPIKNCLEVGSLDDAAIACLFFTSIKSHGV